MKSVAVIATTFNRKEKTVLALKTLMTDKYNLSFYICDDASTDGTPESIIEVVPGATVIKGSGNLFWCKGMYFAMKEAFKAKHDFYLMINDDVEFVPNAVSIMVEAYIQAGESCAIVGATKDKQDGATSYGGKKAKSNSFISPNGILQECDLANWNCFLIDQSIANRIGLIDNTYSHSFGDYDYSLRIKRNSIKIYLAPEYIGYCSRNKIQGTFQDRTLTKDKRLKLFKSAKGLDWKSNIHYYTKNMDYLGFGGLIKFVASYLKNRIYISLGI